MAVPAARASTKTGNRREGCGNRNHRPRSSLIRAVTLRLFYRCHSLMTELRLGVKEADDRHPSCSGPPAGLGREVEKPCYSQGFYSGCRFVTLPARPEPLRFSLCCSSAYSGKPPWPCLQLVELPAPSDDGSFYWCLVSLADRGSLCLDRRYLRHGYCLRSSKGLAGIRTFRARRRARHNRTQG